MDQAPSEMPPPIVSQRSRRAIRMPARFADFLPGTVTHLAHMPPTNRQQRGRDVISDQTANHPHTPSPSPSDHTGGVLFKRNLMKQVSSVFIPLGPPPFLKTIL
jgi:hypothetical protein